MEPISRRDAIAAGLTDWDLRQRVQKGSLVRIGRGSYLDSGPLADLTPEERHRLAALAAFPKLAPGSVLSHRSAAALHGLPVWTDDLSRVDVTRRGATTRSTSRTNFFGHPLRRDEIVQVDGVSVTSLSRTVLDLACCLPFEEAVVTGDAALHRGTERPLVRDRKGAAKARASIAFMDGLSESAGESRSRVLFHLRRLPAPLLQRPIYGSGYIARVDFVWPEFSVVGEFDGEGKYRGRYGDGVDALVNEKYREDAIRSQGWRVVRWSWADLDDPQHLLTRLRTAFSEGTPHARFAA